MNNEGNLKSGEEIFRQLEGANRANWLIEYKTLLNAIPRTWKDILTTGSKTMKVKKEIRPYTVVNNRQVFMLPKKAKELYQLLIKKIDERPYVERYWNTIMPDNKNGMISGMLELHCKEISNYPILILNYFTKSYQVKKTYINGNCQTRLNADLDVAQLGAISTCL